ncbi:MAG: hypothetical protein DRR42_19560 [Gammaproteobacteria bacterium]|nr:MAG: hypothetical protein DRR42_19560 [Gammaproteobacteria bacterium]
MALDFEWDQIKSRQNTKKHGISFREGATAFADKLSYTISDPEHSHAKGTNLVLLEPEVATSYNESPEGSKLEDCWN